MTTIRPQTSARARPGGALPTVAERVASGKQARASAPRSSHALYEPAPDRRDPVALLEEQAATRVPQLVPIRYGRMLASPFAFFRGASRLMAADLAGTPASGITAQLCGDAHLSNFGVYASPERRLVFDINDFDETLPGPWEWDVKRLAASLAVAGRANGFTAKQRAAIVFDAVHEYRQAMNRLARMRTLEVWYMRMEVERLVERYRRELPPEGARRLDRALEKARTRDTLQAVSRLTHLVDGEPRIKSDPPLVVPVEELSAAVDSHLVETLLTGILRSYRRSLPSDRRALLSQFRLVHFAHKVVGVGSVGTRAWIALLLGSDNDDPLFLQIKQAESSVLEEFLPRSAYRNAGERVVAGQRLMQALSDIFLGWHRVTGIDGQERDFYVRQLRDWKGSAEIAAMLPAGMALYARLCGATLARAHARSGDRIAIAAYLGRGDAFERALAAFAERYADQNERDYRLFAEAVEAGRISARTGV